MDEIRTNGSVCTYHPGLSGLYSNLSVPASERNRDRYPHIQEGMMAPTHHHQQQQHPHLPCGARDQYNPSPKSDNSATTLQSVLRGEVPAAYSHLAPQRKVDQGRSPVYQRGVCSPVLGGSPSERYIPSPHMISSPHSHSQDSISSHLSRESRSPYHESRSPFQEPRSPFQESRSPFQEPRSPFHESRSPYHEPRSPYQEPSSPYSDIRPSYIAPRSPYQEPRCYEEVYPPSPVEGGNSQDEPMDLSTKSDHGGDSPAHSPHHPDSPCYRSEEGSMLRNLLCLGKQMQGQSRSARDSPCRDSPRNVEMAITSTTKVTLAKKNMFPITSRVSDWLVKIVRFAKSIPEFASMSQNDKMTLMLNSWTRLLLLFMAEHDFEFAVTPLPLDRQTPDVDPAPDEPTMKSVEGIQSFIKKCKNKDLDQKEYAFLRMAVLFNAGYVGLERPDQVDQLNLLVQQLLKQHVQDTRPDDVMHYPRLLMCLPALYGINCKMFENLFCLHINASMDMEVLLKEMLQNL